ncbi:molybdopterin-guanine dinucleotide biosynthesis protein B, partial [Marinobacter alexandrii]|uniref:molybdopterin-guanine dinucleotide biosynthesis protein B n=1 Tax=Marinobacter alexandrii TaxID=2570351 RepID=UPI0032991041
MDPGSGRVAGGVWAGRLFQHQYARGSGLGGAAPEVNVIGIVGWKNSGKTTLASALIRELTVRGLRVNSIKHAHHGVDV